MSARRVTRSRTPDRNRAARATCHTAKQSEASHVESQSSPYRHGHSGYATGSVSRNTECLVAQRERFATIGSSSSPARERNRSRSPRGIVSKNDAEYKPSANGRGNRQWTWNWDPKPWGTFWRWSEQKQDWEKYENDWTFTWKPWELRGTWWEWDLTKNNGAGGWVKWTGD